MNRRTTLATLFGQKKLSKQTASAAVLLSSLEPYTGTFEVSQAAHLLRRAMFGPTRTQIIQATDAGLEETLDSLFADQDLPEPPVNFFFQDDPNVPVGETWVDAPYANVQSQNYRVASLGAWTVGLMLNEGVSLREKMTLFWHNHFVTAGVNDPKFVYRYITTLRENALGNFRTLAELMTVDPAMLRYLNGNQNDKNAPNENYARELFELFTIGKGLQIGDGDYSTYTEDDVIAAARVLTGWRDRGFFTTNPDQAVESTYVNFRHDTGDKQFSYHFDNQTITNNGAEEYKDLIAMIFAKEETAIHLARKLYRWFVYYIIDEQTEIDVIQPLAQVLIDNDYDVKPAIRALLGSQHFFDVLNFGPMIKNPTDYLVSLLKTNEVQFPAAYPAYYNLWLQVGEKIGSLGMPILSPPSVAGYPAYYQEPAYYRIWINSATLPEFVEVVDILSGPGINIGNFQLQIDVLSIVQELTNPGDPNDLINELATLFFPQGVTDGQRDYLKSILILGLPDFEWTVEYGSWVADPDDAGLAASVEAKLRSLWAAMLSMPEYFLS